MNIRIEVSILTLCRVHMCIVHSIKLMAKYYLPASESSRHRILRLKLHEGVPCFRLMCFVPAGFIRGIGGGFLAHFNIMGHSSPAHKLQQSNNNSNYCKPAVAATYLPPPWFNFPPLSLISLSLSWKMAYLWPRRRFLSRKEERGKLQQQQHTI